ncbi:hypothetical protein [Spiroplasma endosymbiont of Dactylopius coccus]
MNKEKIIENMKKRIDFITEKIEDSKSKFEINKLFNRLYELEKWYEAIINGDFDND